MMQHVPSLSTLDGQSAITQALFKVPYECDKNSTLVSLTPFTFFCISKDGRFDRNAIKETSKAV